LNSRREVVIVSGKGGVGKTTISASLAFFLHSNGYKIVASDADVDTPSLKLLIPLKNITKKFEVKISRKAVIDYLKCIGCGKCLEHCAYGAITRNESGMLEVAHFMCEGCGVCKLVCPVNAINLVMVRTGELITGETIHGFPMATAQLEVGEHNSGLLVGVVKNEAGELAKSINADLILTDGAPGIGCPVIAALLGASYAIVIVEPTPQSFKGALRVIEVAHHFKVPVGIIINKFDISNYITEIEKELKSTYEVDVLGKVPFDFEVLRSVAQRKPVLEFNPDSRASKALTKAFESLLEVLNL